MDADDANDLRMFNDQERKRKQKEEELNEWAVILGGSAICFILTVYWWLRTDAVLSNW